MAYLRFWCHSCLPPAFFATQGLLPSLVTSPVSLLLVAWPEGVLSLLWYLCWVLMGHSLTSLAIAFLLSEPLAAPVLGLPGLSCNVFVSYIPHLSLYLLPRRSIPSSLSNTSVLFLALRLPEFCCVASCSRFRSASLLCGRCSWGRGDPPPSRLPSGVPLAL